MILYKKAEWENPVSISYIQDKLNKYATKGEKELNNLETNQSYTGGQLSRE